MIRRPLVPLAVVALLVVPGQGRAQETPKAEAPKAETPKAETPKAEAPNAEAAAARRGPTATLRVQIVISRFQGERKVASLPYALLVTVGDSRTRMRMGVDTPIPTTTTSSDTGKPLTSYQYRNVGTNIDCSAKDRGEGRYQLSIGVENSSALAGVGAHVEGVPLFRRFETHIDPILRDGQSVETVASTDPVTGELVRIDVTMNVVK